MPFTGKAPKPPKPPKDPKRKQQPVTDEAITPLTTGSVTKGKPTANVAKLTKRP